MSTTTNPHALPIAEAIEALSELTAYNLASMADCGSPDSPESVGAMLLVHVRDAVVEYLEGHDAGQYNEDERDAYAHEIPDGAPSVYTHERWAEFVDLAAYNEDPTEYGAPDDMNQAAAVCLYIIAERLFWALLAEVGIER